MKRNYKFFIADILYAIGKIEKYTKNLNISDFVKDALVIDAVIRNFEVIGEAAKNIPLEVKKKYPEIPWATIAGMRNKLTHEYFGINFKVLWKTIKEDLPDLEDKISKIPKDRTLF